MFIVMISSMLFVAVLSSAEESCLIKGCSSDRSCEPVIYECSSAPCVPRFECVPSADNCLTTVCNEGEQCVLKKRSCARMGAVITELPQCQHRPTCVIYPQCPINEEYRECNGEDCEPSCEVSQPLCPAGCGTGGCVCLDGFVRHKGKCIKKEECPKHECPLFEVYESCPGTCTEQTCANADQKVDIFACKRVCGPGRCMCFPGYVRDSGNNCIPKFFCGKFENSILDLQTEINKDTSKNVHITTISDPEGRMGELKVQDFTQ